MTIWPFQKKVLKKDFEGKLTIFPFGTIDQNGFRIYGNPFKIYKGARIKGTSRIEMDDGRVFKLKENKWFLE